MNSPSIPESPPADKPRFANGQPLAPTEHQVAAWVRHRLPKFRRQGGEYRGPCPVHQGKRDSFAINAETGQAFCHSQCGRGWDLLGLEQQLTGADFKEALASVESITGRLDGHKDGLGRIVATYDYTNEGGELLYQVCRFDPKDFRQRRPDGSGGWVWNLNGVSRIPYRLAEVVAADSVFIVEGEKDVEIVRGLGLVGTCNPGGAEKWRPEFGQHFASKHVSIIPDADEPGRRHALQVAENLLGTAASVQVLELPCGKDVTEWGGGREELLVIATAAEPLTAESLATLRARWFPQQQVGLEPAEAKRPILISEPAGRPDLLNGFDPGDIGNAQRLIALYGDDMRYCHPFRKWVIWDGRRWAPDTTERARRRAKEAAIAFLGQAMRAGLKDLEKFARESTNEKRIVTMLSSAECEIFVSPAELDTNPHLLNFLNGTVDLRTGAAREHRREDFITKLVQYDYQPGAECATFRRFLERVMGGGPDAGEPERARADRLIEYLQVAFGYSLTGFTSEKAVFLCYGAGNNGKTTLLNTFRRLLEEYSVLLQIDTLMVRQESNNTQADLADLRGARYVMTSETEEGQRLAEGKLKRITQGMGRIKAVRKYENPVEFEESHKLWMDANHKPLIRGTDNAIWNRLHLIPFTVTIPDEDIDRELPDRLMAEAEGILAWAVEGAQRWYRAGLGKPAEVSKAGRDWRSESDQIGRFVEECCVVGDFAQVRGRQLYQAYRQWAEGAGEHAIRESDLAQRMAERGFSKKHTNQGVAYSGLGLRTDSDG